MHPIGYIYTNNSKHLIFGINSTHFQCARKEKADLAAE